jgi:hypothetical protein
MNQDREKTMTMNEHENEMLELLSSGPGTRTLLGGTGAVKERIRRVREASKLGTGPDTSCGGVGGGWGNSPVDVDVAPGSCGGVGGGWGNSPEF